MNTLLLKLRVPGEPQECEQARGTGQLHNTAANTKDPENPRG